MGLFYIYALTKHDVALPNIEGMRKDSFGNFYAVYVEVSEAIFSEVALAEHLQDPVWVAQQAQHHQQVVAQLFAQTAVVPFRMATLFATWERMQKNLLEKAFLYARMLEFFEGKTEWSVKCYFDIKNAELVLPFLQDEALKALQEEIAGASAGKAFLLQKKLADLLSEKLDLLLQKYLDQVQIALTLQSVGVMALRTHSKQVTARPEQMLRNLAFFVHQEQLSTFEQLFAKHRKEAADRGVVLEISGPWPPYHFAV